METIGEVKDNIAIDLGSLLDAGDGAVVTLVAGDTRLLAHKAVLSARSPVFAAMFRHNTLEASRGEVAIPVVEGPVLRQLLAYLYTLQAPQLPAMAPQLLAAADKYGVSVLKAECEKQVAAQLSVETAVTTALLATRHSCTILKQAAIAYMKTHVLEVMATQGWADTVATKTNDFIELSRLVSEISAPAPADVGASPSTQPHSDRGDCSHNPAPPMAVTHHTPPPDEAAVSRLRSLSPEEKNRGLIEAAKQGAVGELEALLAAGADVGPGTKIRGGGPPCTGRQTGDARRRRGGCWRWGRRWTPGTVTSGRLCMTLQTTATRLWCGCCWPTTPTTAPGVRLGKRRCTWQQAMATQRRRLPYWRRAPTGAPGTDGGTRRWT